MISCARGRASCPVGEFSSVPHSYFRLPHRSVSVMGLVRQYQKGLYLPLAQFGSFRVPGKSGAGTPGLPVTADSVSTGSVVCRFHTSCDWMRGVARTWTNALPLFQMELCRVFRT